MGSKKLYTYPQKWLIATVWTNLPISGKSRGISEKSQIDEKTYVRIPVVISRLQSVDLGTAHAQSSFLSCFPLHLEHVDPFRICQYLLPMAFPYIAITTTTSLLLWQTQPSPNPTHPAALLKLLMTLQPLSQPGQNQEHLPHKLQNRKWSKFESAGSHRHFSPVLLTTHFSRKFSQTV